VTCVVYSPNGTHLISGGHDNVLRAWERCHR
jgi:WD40 repeat protein